MNRGKKKKPAPAARGRSARPPAALQALSGKAIVLCALASGQAYAAEIAARAKGIEPLTDGALYPALAWLEEAGLVVKAGRPGNPKAPPGQQRRTYYRLAPSGTDALVRLRALFSRLAQIKIAGAPDVKPEEAPPSSPRKAPRRVVQLDPAPAELPPATPAFALPAPAGVATPTEAEPKRWIELEPGAG